MRLLAGLSAGAIYVPGMALLSRCFPEGRRAGALGMYTAALVGAYAGGYLVAAPLAEAFGWRTGILATSVPAIIAAFLVMLFVEEPALAGPNPRQRPGAISGCVTVAVLLSTLAYCGHMWEQYAFWGWVGPYVASMGKSPVLASGVILVGVAGSLLGGHMADRFGQLEVIVCAGLMSFIGEAVVTLGAGGVALGALFWTGFWVVSDSAVYKAFLADLVPDGKRGWYLGLQSAVGFAFTIVSPVVFGAILAKDNPGVPAVNAANWGRAFLALGLGGLAAPVCGLCVRQLVSRSTPPRVRAG